MISYYKCKDKVMRIIHNLMITYKNIEYIIEIILYIMTK